MVERLDVGVCRPGILAASDEAHRGPREPEPAERHEREQPRREIDEMVEETFNNRAFKECDTETGHRSGDRSEQHRIARSTREVADARRAQVTIHSSQPASA